MGDTSHWNAWAIAEETVRIFVEPVLQRIAGARPWLPRRGSWNLWARPSQDTDVFDTAPLTMKRIRPEALASPPDSCPTR
jgi:hypothetical protein